MAVLEKIHTGGFSAYLHGYGAIDSWLNTQARTEKTINILTNADTASLARMFDGLRYPGVDLADAALGTDDCARETSVGNVWYFRCADSIRDYRPSFNILKFFKDCKTNKFHDPDGIYPLLNGIRQDIYNSQKGIRNINNEIRYADIFLKGLNPNNDYTRTLMNAALILAKYFYKSRLPGDILKLFYSLPQGSVPGQEEQRLFLYELMTSANPGLGLELLKTSGFLNEFWPEVASLEKADHSKEFHPEGNAWEHTMETFRHRKASWINAHDFRLSLGLLLHDIGKPHAPSAGSHRYDGHAELGEIQARRFLGRLGFNAFLINDIGFLVKNHMLPAALPRLPLFRTAEIMSSPLFPTLMELYRCDESSSFKGLDNYYESSAAYQSFLRNKKNPYRTADGKKLTGRN